MVTLIDPPELTQSPPKQKPKRRFQKLTAPLDRDRAVSMTGVDSTMEAFKRAITELLKRALAADKQGVELPTFLAILRDQSRR